MRWDEILTRAERYQIERPVIVVLTILKTLFPVDIPDKMLHYGARHGLTDNMIQTILKENIFFEGSTLIDLPQKIKELAGAKSLAEKVHIMRSMIIIFFSQYKSRFYSDLRPSVLRAFFVICAKHAHSLQRYCRACYRMIRYPKKTRRDISVASHLQKQKVSVRKWIRKEY